MNKFAVTIRSKLRLAFATCISVMLGCVYILGSNLTQRAARGAPMDWVSLEFLAFAVFGCVTSIALGVHLHRTICGGLDRMGQKFEEIANTLDLSRRSASPRMDEFGRAAVAFDKLMHRVESAMSTVSASVESATNATREMAAGNLDLSARTEEQAAALQQTAASMAELTNTVKQNAENAREATVLANDALGVAESGSIAVLAMVDVINRINGSSDQISEITGTIESIAFQTNILALNAAVEAARAGEQGKGFAVVASEVRNLAHRSSAAAKEIKDLIAESVNLIQEGSEQATKVNSSISHIRDSASRVSEFVADIAHASDAQSEGIEQVNQAIAQMDSVTQQNAALVEQAAATSGALEDQMTKLQDAVSAFKRAG